MELEQTCKGEYSLTCVTEDPLKRLVGSGGLDWDTGSHCRVSNKGSRLDSCPFTAATWEGSVDGDLRGNAVCTPPSSRLGVCQNPLDP